MFAVGKVDCLCVLHHACCRIGMGESEQTLAWPQGPLMHATGLAPVPLLHSAFVREDMQMSWCICTLPGFQHGVFQALPNLELLMQAGGTQRGSKVAFSVAIPHP
jgi:hypothetical protein